MFRKTRNKTPYCTNCGKVLRDQDNYCPHCGQENDNKRQSFGKVMIDLVQGFLSIDSRIAHSLPALLFRPGYLTREFVAGRRQRYLDPVRMFITIVVFYFLISSSAISKFMNRDGDFASDTAFVKNEHSVDTILVQEEIPEKAQSSNKKTSISYDNSGTTATNLTLGIYKFDELKEMVLRGKTNTREIIDSLQIENTLWHRFLYGEAVKFVKADFKGFPEYFLSKLPWIIFCLIPIFAILLKLLYLRGKFMYIDHLIFAFHLHSFIFLMLIFGNVFGIFSLDALEKWTGIGILVYIPFAFRNFYERRWIKTLAKLTLLLVLYAIAGFIFGLLAMVVAFIFY